MELNETWEKYLKDNGAGFVHFIDTSTFDINIVDGYNSVVLFGKILSKEYINAIITNKNPKTKEFFITEHKMDALAVKLANQLENEGYKSISKIKFGLLPHKTVALRIGLGFIGKNNLLNNPKYGCALVLGKIITTAPFLTTKSVSPMKPKCGNCNICVEKCPTKALHGNTWNIKITRDEMLVRKLCNCCIMCMVWCPYTMKYAKK